MTFKSPFVIVSTRDAAKNILGTTYREKGSAAVRVVAVLSNRQAASLPQLGIPTPHDILGELKDVANDDSRPTSAFRCLPADHMSIAKALLQQRLILIKGTHLFVDLSRTTETSLLIKSIAA